MTNFDRGDRAERALRAVGVTHVRGDGFADGYPLSDHIADLCHLARRHDLDVRAVVARGVAHFAADVIEQAWQHSEDWAATLQDPANLDRALSVMATAGVPDFVHEEALRYVGLLPPGI